AVFLMKLKWRGSYYYLIGKWGQIISGKTLEVGQEIRVRWDNGRWQKKMHFLLTTLKVVYVLTTPMPELVEDATVEAIRIRAKWENDDYICSGHILNEMDESFTISVSSIIDKLPPSWKDFKHTLKHGKDDLSLVQLGSHLRIEEMVNSMLSYSGLSEGFWGEAMLTACYLLTRVPNKRNTTIPYELWLIPCVNYCI
ncbi:hypothetical protein Tco_1148335, partial [Tanacetum coccineum]